MEASLISPSRLKKWRLILSGHADPYSNMAMDEAILESYLELGAPPTLRIYGWQPAAFSIGFSQEPEVNLDIAECARSGVGIVRRMTGGGVLYHCDDISYSVVCSPEDLGCEKSVVESFERTCAFLINMYRWLGIDAKFAFSDGSYPGRYVKPSPLKADLCMASNERYDIVVAGRKLGGNAQKRRKGAILQHGSIPLKNTIAGSRRFLKEGARIDPGSVLSLGEALGRGVSYSEAERLIATAFRGTFGFDMTRDFLTAGELEAFERLLDSKYSTGGWNLERDCDPKKAVLA